MPITGQEIVEMRIYSRLVAFIGKTRDVWLLIVSGSSCGYRRGVTLLIVLKIMCERLWRA